MAVIPEYPWRIYPPERAVAPCGATVLSESSFGTFATVESRHYPQETSIMLPMRVMEERSYGASAQVQNTVQGARLIRNGLVKVFGV